MEFLKWLEELRTPFFDTFFTMVTKFGEETVMILIALLFLWCINKKKAMYLLVVGIYGLAINQFTKITARVQRPWIKDPSFTIVESAREAATGYSFPSGHTQISVGLYGCLAKIADKLWVKIIAVAFAMLVPFSRLYLGVHFFGDVAFSVVSAIVLVFVLFPIIEKNYDNIKVMNILFAVLFLLVLGYLLYVSLFDFPQSIDVVNLESAIKAGYTMLGSTLGIWLGYIMDKKIVNYDTQAVWWAQIIKFVGGVFVYLVLSKTLKTVLPMHPSADGVRYFISIFVLMGLWPMTFAFFPKQT